MGLEHTQIFLNTNPRQQECKWRERHSWKLRHVVGELTNLYHLLQRTSKYQLCLYFKGNDAGPTCCTGFLLPFEEENISANPQFSGLVLHSSSSMLWFCSLRRPTPLNSLIIEASLSDFPYIKEASDGASRFHSSFTLKILPFLH